MFTPERELTQDDFTEFLSEGMTVSDITEHFGKPNSTKIMNDSRKAFYYSIDNDELGYQDTSALNVPAEERCLIAV